MMSRGRAMAAVTAAATLGVAVAEFLRRRRLRQAAEEAPSIASMSARWRRDLLENVVPFWEKAVDKTHGGYFTAYDADGSLLDDTKYSWLQCRAVYMWSKLHNDFRGELDDAVTERWFANAQFGAAFLERLKDEHGRLFFSVSRNGCTPLHFQRKPFAGMFYCLACVEYSQALLVRSDGGESWLRPEVERWRGEAIRYFELFRGWLDRPQDLGGLAFPAAADADAPSSLAGVMCLAGLSEALLVAWPEQRDRWLQYVADAQSRVVRHLDPVRGILRENARATSGVSDGTAAGRLFNPGHSVEVAWFLLHLCQLRPDPPLRELALHVLENSLRLGWDEVHAHVHVHVRGHRRDHRRGHGRMAVAVSMPMPMSMPTYVCHCHRYTEACFT